MWRYKHSQYILRKFVKNREPPCPAPGVVAPGALILVLGRGLRRKSLIYKVILCEVLRCDVMRCDVMRAQAWAFLGHTPGRRLGASLNELGGPSWAWAWGLGYAYQGAAWARAWGLGPGPGLCVPGRRLGPTWGLPGAYLGPGLCVPGRDTREGPY